MSVVGAGGGMAVGEMERLLRGVRLVGGHSEASYLSAQGHEVNCERDGQQLDRQDDLQDP